MSSRTYVAYEKIIAAMNDSSLNGPEKFSLIGSVMTQMIENVDLDAAAKHRLVDEFAKTAHSLIGAKP